MNIKPICAYLIVGSLLVVMQSPHALAQQNSDASKTNVQQAPPERDGQHDFDFEIGPWKTHLSRLQHPLTGSHAWVEYEGTTVVRKIWNGRANLVELEVTGPAGHIEGLSLRLYNPTARQWSLNFASSSGGVLEPSPRLANSSMDAASFTIRKNSTTAPSWFDSSSPISPPIPATSNRHSPMTAARLGKSIGSQPIPGRRIPMSTKTPRNRPPDRRKPALPPLRPRQDGQHDFDFEIGHWDIPLQRLVDRLAGSHTWVKFDGTSVTRKVWNGRSQIEEFEADSPQRPYRRLDPALVRTGNPSVAPLLGQQQDRRSRAAPNRPVQERRRRVLCTGHLERQNGHRPLPLDQHHHQQASLRAVFLRRWRQNLGSQLIPIKHGCQTGRQAALT